MSSAIRAAVVVFTRDLRVHDNPALAAACAEADAIVPLFVIDDTITSSTGANRIAFLSDSLRDVDRSLRERGGRLVLRRGSWIDEVLAVAQSVSAGAVHLASDVSGLARRRIDALSRAAEAVGVKVREHPGITVVPPGELQPAGGGEYKVFTPYHARWAAARWREPAGPCRRFVLPEQLRLSSPESPGVERLGDLLGDAVRTGRSPHVIIGGERAGNQRLDAFEADALEQYDDRRDALAEDATSRLSPYLHLGCLSPTTVATRLRSQVGGEAFVRQLCWRDFFHQVLAARPDAAHADYRSGGHRWDEDDEAFDAWREGRTGYPLVDAAMRQLKTEGFMHNRARMVVASFLCKHLYLDWRLGAAHFMSWLVDGDLANNQLNWQWVAGTGTDSNPNRVFNPVTQGRRFDPDGAYVRRFVPELAGLRSNAVHWPDPVMRTRAGYEPPIVGHREAVAAYRARRRPTGRATR